MHEMSQQVFKLVCVLCLIACVFIAFSTDAKWYQKYSQQVHNSDAYDKCCQLTREQTLHNSSQLLSSDLSQEVNRQNVSKHRILQQINQNSFKIINNKVDLSYVKGNCDFHLSMIFTATENNSKNNKSLDRKLYRSLSSIIKNSNAMNLCIHLITDIKSQFRAKAIIKQIYENNSSLNNEINFYFHDIDSANSVIKDLLPSLKSHFSYKPNSYYSHSLFFLSLAFHRIFERIDNILLIDIDVQLRENLLELYSQFSLFNSQAVIGIAHEQQPVYRHILHEYRHKVNNETRLGSPPPKGLPGFNSGVLLMNLKRMRESKLYNSLLNPYTIHMLCNKYAFRGHLGDQDFYTIVSFDYQQLFHVIPCFWNRQLCQWWRYHGYGHVFDEYHTCDGNIKLFHGNCNTVLPQT